MEDEITDLQNGQLTLRNLTRMRSADTSKVVDGSLSHHVLAEEEFEENAVVLDGFVEAQIGLNTLF